MGQRVGNVAVASDGAYRLLGEAPCSLFLSNYKVAQLWDCSNQPPTTLVLVRRLRTGETIAALTSSQEGTASLAADR